MTRITTTLLALILLSACSREPQRQAPTPGPIEAETGGAAGYQHGVERSRFAVGANVRGVDERGFLKMVGATGTFAVDAVNGAAAGVPNASRVAVAETHPPASLDPVQHNKQVLDYFLGVGIRQEQVAGVDALTLLAASGETRSPRPVQPKVIGYQSALKRGVEGVPVADSVAWARFADGNEVVSEGLYWPAIPGAVVADAAKLRQRLASGETRQSFVALLPAGLPAGEVVIHHSPATARDAFHAVATYDVVAPIYAPGVTGARRSEVPVSWVVRHFDGQGREIRLPHEQVQRSAQDERDQQRSRK